MVPAISATLGRWSARGDSNPDLHGLNVPRLPIAPRADDGLVPSGGLEPPPHGLRTRRAAFTLRRGTGADPGDRTRTSAIPGPQAAVTSDQRLERMAGLEPAPQGLEGPQATVTPHSPWFGLRYQSLIPGPNTDRWRSPAQELLSVVKEPALANCLATAPGFEPGPTRFGGVSTASETKPPHDLTRLSSAPPDQNKKGLPGDRPRRPVSR
jgi:hypothetical protein